jgi:hypothetical protein
MVEDVFIRDAEGQPYLGQVGSNGPNSCCKPRFFKVWVMGGHHMLVLVGDTHMHDIEYSKKG